VFLPYVWENCSPDSGTSQFSGVIGAFASRISIQTANLLGIYNVPQVMIC